jgi:hypothetical protein
VVDFLSKPFSALGLLLGVVAILTVLEQPWGFAKGVPFVAAALSLLALVLIGPWPWAGQGSSTEQAPDPAEVLVVPRNDQGMQRRSPLPADQWYDASQGDLQQQGIRVSVSDVVLGFPRLLNNGTRRSSPTRALSIRVRVANASLVRKVEFTGWTSAAEADDPAVRLTDNTGQTWNPRRLPSGWTPDVAERGSLGPGRAAQDTLLFEPQAGSFEWLRLELPASAFQGIGVLRLQIPQSMIKHL